MIWLIKYQRLVAHSETTGGQLANQIGWQWHSLLAIDETIQIVIRLNQLHKHVLWTKWKNVSLHVSRRGQLYPGIRLHVSRRGQLYTAIRLHVSTRGQLYPAIRLHVSTRRQLYPAIRLHVSTRGQLYTAIPYVYVELFRNTNKTVHYKVHWLNLMKFWFVHYCYGYRELSLPW